MIEEEKAAAEAAAKAEAEKAAAEEAARKEREAAGNVDDATAKLEEAQAEVARLQAIADKFAGIDPEKAKKDAETVAAAEAARVEAEKAKAKAEGDFAKLKELQDAETAAKIEAAEKRAAEAEAAAETARKEANAEKKSTAFANSAFLAQKTILSGPRAERLFGDYVDVEGGKVIVYDKPADEAKRAKVMDAKGNPLPFNEAIEKVINAQEDKDTLLKTSVKPGAGSTTTDGKTVPPGKSRHERLAAGLAALRSEK